MNKHSWRMTLFGILMGVLTGIGAMAMAARVLWPHICF